MCSQQGRETLVAAKETEHLVWRKWCFGSVATIQQPQVRNMVTGDCYIHFKKTNLPNTHLVWWAFTCWAHNYDSRNSFCESVSTVIIWLWESIWGGWVLIFYHSLNNMFVWKTFYHTRVRWLVFEVLFLPTVDVIYCMYNWQKRKTYYCVFCNLNVLSLFT